MRANFLLVLCVCLADMLSAQTFHARPDPVLEKEIDFNQANECFIHFDNPSGDSLRLHWRLVESNLPPEWDTDLCDYGTCYIGIPSNGLMNTVYDTIQPYLKLIVQPGNAPGAAWVWFRVYEEGNPDNSVDVFYSLHTPGTLETTAQTGVSYQVYPNPVSRVLFLENKQAFPVVFRLTNASGQLLLAKDIPALSEDQVSVEHWPDGTYFLQCANQVQKILVKK